MELLLKDVIVTDPASGFNRKKVHIAVEKGMISSILSGKAPPPQKKTRVIEGAGCTVTPSFVDMHAHLCDPGTEHRENLSTGRVAGMEGGFSHIAVLPETFPPLENKESIGYILSGNALNPTHLLPLGAATQNLDGESLAQMHDLAEAGALAFTNGNKPLTDGGTIIRAMQYAGSFGKPFLNTPGDPAIDRFGAVHEGKIHLTLGLKGQPALSEELAVQRNIAFCEYTGARLHFTKISARQSLRHIEAARKQGLPVSAGVSVNNLLFCEDDLETMDTRLKLMPVLRAREDMEALRDAVSSGLIECIVSDHFPLEEEQKSCAFESAAYGAIGLQTYYPALLRAFKDDSWLHAATAGPRKVLGLDPSVIKEKAPAMLTLWAPDEEWTLDHKTNRSRSHNSPFWEEKLKGRAAGVINRKNTWFRNPSSR